MDEETRKVQELISANQNPEDCESRLVKELEFFTCVLCLAKARYVHARPSCASTQLVWYLCLAAGAS